MKKENVSKKKTVATKKVASKSVKEKKVTTKKVATKKADAKKVASDKVSEKTEKKQKSYAWVFILILAVIIGVVAFLNTNKKNAKLAEAPGPVIEETTDGTIEVVEEVVVVENAEEPEEDEVDDNETVVASDDFKAWIDVFNGVIKSNTGLPMFDEAYGSTVEINENANGTYDLYANIYNPQFTEETFCRDTFKLVRSLIESNDYQKYFRNIDIDFTSDLNTISHNIKVKNYYKRNLDEIDTYIEVE